MNACPTAAEAGKDDDQKGQVQQETNRTAEDRKRVLTVLSGTVLLELHPLLHAQTWEQIEKQAEAIWH